MRNSDYCPTKPVWLLVAPMYNHGSHHRGQLTAAFSQMGLDDGVTDLASMPESP